MTKRRIILILVFIALFPTIWWVKSPDHTQTHYTSNLVPTVMIPGSSGTTHSYDEMLASLNTGRKTHSIIRVSVGADDKVTVSGNLKPHDIQPYIVIGFQDNADGDDAIYRQAKWTQVAMTYLTNRYHFSKFRSVGYSNGGLIWTLYLENYLPKHGLTMDRLLMLGAPFNGTDETNQITSMLAGLEKNRKKIPKDLVVYSVAGTEDYTSDGVVPRASVDTGKYIFQKRVRHYTEVLITGADTTHTNLPANKTIANLIKRVIVDVAP